MDSPRVKRFQSVRSRATTSVLLITLALCFGPPLGQASRPSEASSTTSASATRVPAAVVRSMEKVMGEARPERVELITEYDTDCFSVSKCYVGTWNKRVGTIEIAFTESGDIVCRDEDISEVEAPLPVVRRGRELSGDRPFRIQRSTIVCYRLWVGERQIVFVVNPAGE